MKKTIYNIFKKVSDAIETFLDSVYVYFLYTILGFVYGSLYVYNSLFFLTFETYTCDGDGTDKAISFEMTGIEFLIIGLYLLVIGIYSLIKVIKYFKK